MGAAAILLAGIPSENPSLYHRLRFAVGDPAAWIRLRAADGQRTVVIVRDIEVERARRHVSADEIACPADYAPPQGLSGDRATATAQSVVELLRRHGVERVLGDRTLPWIFAWHIMQAGIGMEYDADLGVRDRRVKDAQELEWIAEAQRVTEAAMEMACGTVAHAHADADGYLRDAEGPLTCQRLHRAISRFLLERDYSTPHGSIVATTPEVADCHERGHGPLRTGEPVVIDIFPRSNTTLYWGDCTRTVVHGTPRDELVRMHAAVVAAKQAALATARAGVEAEDVHRATTSSLQQHGYRFVRGMVSEDEPIMPHGTGHGIGLEVHEPILLDDGGGQLLAGEVMTIEPGLYCRKYGGVRVEDMVVIGSDAPPRNLNRLPEGLDWRCS
ncbi:MAG: Xaa-Pro aminopeptidase [Pirellulaceae bacterium]|nr:MAG: Xaa-Pro aminopeptidase [Pirellulaceae bacterium]